MSETMECSSINNNTIVQAVEAFKLQLMELSMNVVNRVPDEQAQSFMNNVYQVHDILTQMMNVSNISDFGEVKVPQLTVTFGTTFTKMDIDGSSGDGPHVIGAECCTIDQHGPEMIGKQVTKKPKVTGQLVIQYLDV